MRMDVMPPSARRLDDLQSPASDTRGNTMSNQDASSAVDIPLPGAFDELEPTSGPVESTDGRLRLSFSRVDTYRNCPRKFRYAYIDRLPTRPSPQLSLGSSVHAALEAFYDRKLPTCPSEEELLELLYASWDTRGFDQVSREEQLDYYRHAQQVLRRYHRRVAGDYRLPVTTEAWFELPVDDDIVVVGSIDRVDRDDDGNLHVVDYKTNRRAQDRVRVAGSLQLAIYALACEHLFGALPATVALDFVVADVVVAVPVDEIDLDAARDKVRTTAARIRDEEFEPTPNRLCDWCDFRSVCPAWPDDPDVGLGQAIERLDQLRREVRRQVRELRELEAGVERLRRELGGATATDDGEGEMPAGEGESPSVSG